MLLFFTEKRLSNVQISNENIIKIINNLDLNKAHGHDMINIRMLKVCGPSLCKPLSIIFKSCLNQMKFPMEWKRPMWFRSTKENDKQCIKNYRPVCLLPIWVISLKNFYLTNCASFLMKMIYYHPTSQAFDLVTLA